MKNLKKRLKQGETLHGCWLNTGSSLTAEIVGLSGFDWVLIDLEHGAGSEKDVLYQLQALEHTKTAAIVRVESSESQRIHRVLDMGAEGIMCPKITGPEGAKKVVQGLHYPPDGEEVLPKWFGQLVSVCISINIIRKQKRTFSASTDRNGGSTGSSGRSGCH